jgi:hypothetical protein
MRFLAAGASHEKNSFHHSLNEDEDTTASEQSIEDWIAEGIAFIVPLREFQILSSATMEETIDSLSIDPMPFTASHL